MSDRKHGPTGPSGYDYGEYFTSGGTYYTSTSTSTSTHLGRHFSSDVKYTYNPEVNAHDRHEADFISDDDVVASDPVIAAKIDEEVELMCPVCGAPIVARVSSRKTSRSTGDTEQIYSFTYTIVEKICECPIVGFVK